MLATADMRAKHFGSCLALFLTSGAAVAYERFQDGCDACHDWVANPYISPKGDTWPASAHNVHRGASFMDTDCDVCHTSSDGNNPFLAS